MKVSSRISRVVMATVVAGAVAAPAAHAVPAHNGSELHAAQAAKAAQAAQLDMHASTVVPAAPKGNVVTDIRGEASKPAPAPKGNVVVTDIRGEASKPAPSTPAVPGVPVFPTDTTPIASPKTLPVATGNGNDGFDWPLAGLLAAIAAAMGGAAYVVGRQLRTHATV